LTNVYNIALGYSVNIFN